MATACDSHSLGFRTHIKLWVHLVTKLNGLVLESRKTVTSVISLHLNPYHIKFILKIWIYLTCKEKFIICYVIYNTWQLQHCLTHKWSISIFAGIISFSWIVFVSVGLVRLSLYFCETLLIHLLDLSSMYISNRVCGFFVHSGHMNIERA